MKKANLYSFILSHWFSRKKSYSGKTLQTAFWSIVIGTMALTVILSVMNGFQLTFINAILHYDSYHIQIKGFNNEIFTFFKKNKYVQHVFAFSEQSTLIMIKNAPPVPVKLKYITKDTAYELGLYKNGQEDTSQIENGSVIIGSELARKLNRSTSQNIPVLEFIISEEDGIVPDIKTFTIAGSFTTGHLDIDESFVFVLVNQETLQNRKDLQTGIILKNKYDFTTVINAIPKNLIQPHDIATWKDYNRSFFNALQLEKNMMILLVSIVYLVVAINIYYGLRRIIVEKYNDIALLKAVGLTGYDIQNIVTVIGAFLGVVGSILGISIGVIISNNINSIIHIINVFIDSISPKSASESLKILSQNSFYLVSIPHAILFSDLLIITFIASFFATISAWYASRRIAYLRPQEVLRYE